MFRPDARITSRPAANCATQISAYAALRRGEDLRAFGRLAADLRPILLVLLERLVFFFVARGCVALDFFFFAILAIAAVSLCVQAVYFLPVESTLHEPARVKANRKRRVKPCFLSMHALRMGRPCSTHAAPDCWFQADEGGAISGSLCAAAGTKRG
jgi:hypothetical protein